MSLILTHFLLLVCVVVPIGYLVYLFWSDFRTYRRTLDKQEKQRQKNLQEVEALKAEIDRVIQQHRRPKP